MDPSSRSRHLQHHQLRRFLALPRRQVAEEGRRSQQPGKAWTRRKLLEIPLRSSQKM